MMLNTHLRICREREKEITMNFQLVDPFHCLVYLYTKKHDIYRNTLNKYPFFLTPFFE